MSRRIGQVLLAAVLIPTGILAAILALPLIVAAALVATIFRLARPPATQPVLWVAGRGAVPTTADTIAAMEADMAGAPTYDQLASLYLVPGEDR